MRKSDVEMVGALLSRNSSKALIREITKQAAKAQAGSIRKREKGHPPGDAGDRIAVWLAAEILIRSGSSKQDAFGRIAKILAKVSEPTRRAAAMTAGRIGSLYYEARERIKASSVETQTQIERAAEAAAAQFISKRATIAIPVIMQRIEGGWTAQILHLKAAKLGDGFGDVRLKLDGAIGRVRFYFPASPL